MRKFTTRFIGFCLILVPKLAWSLVFAAADDQGRRFFLDPDGMHRKGYIVYIWAVQRNPQPDASGVWVVRSQREFDCRLRRTRTMWLTSYADLEEAGSPKQSGAVSNPEWVSVDPDAVMTSLLDQACKMIMQK
ncbi:MAG: surface-adhesin E family protein [Burkholderiaceae bacterium]